MFWRMILAVGTLGFGVFAQTVGVRPYELDWAGRTADDHPPLVDFESMAGWRVETTDAVATFEQSREQQIWGEHVAKLTYRADGNTPEITILPPEPIPVAGAFDAVSCWIYGNNFLGRDKRTPPVTVYVLFADGAGVPFEVNLIHMRWQEWFLCHKRLEASLVERVGKGGATFRGLRVANGRNKEDRVIYFDSLAVFREEFAPLSFHPRARRGVEIFADRERGLNTGEGRLPFPDRQETIVPRPSGASEATAALDKTRFLLASRFDDGGRLEVEIPTGTCQWDGIRLRRTERGDWLRPAVGGGIFVPGPDGKAVAPETVELQAARAVDGRAVASWRIRANGKEATVQTTYWMLGQSLVADTSVTGGVVAEVRFGTVVGASNVRLVTLPYYTYGKADRPAVLVMGAATEPLFLAAHVDWTLSNASEPFALNRLDQDGAACNGGTIYTPKTNGERNPCYERFVFSLSPRFEDVLPEIPNPVSPWKHITGKGLWRAHGAGNRAADAAHWRKVHRHGMTEVIVTDHETGWRDSHESFTFRTKAAPKKGGDQGQFDYARIMQDELGFTYGPYNNYTDFAPVNEFWSFDLISRTPANQLQHAWARCYAPKPSRAVEYCEKLAPIIESKFRFSTAYCDVHTAVTPWSRTDYDYRVPGAGTFAATFYSYGEIMLLQKQAWGGPVYSEGNNHFPYVGLTDGNYAQDQRYRIPDQPWLVDFDLRRMHDLCCNFGMGNLEMFYGRGTPLGETPHEVDASIDRFLAATVAFGHPGFLVFTGGYRNTLRSYYMLQQLQERYTMASASSIHYLAADGTLQDTSAAVASGAYQRNQIVVRYGTCWVVVNGSRGERMRTTVDGRALDLPPNGYAGSAGEGGSLVNVLSADRDGHRADLAVTPKYLYVDGRGEFTRFAEAASDGVGICRILPGNQYEIIPFQGSDCGFALRAAEAVAVSEDRREIGPARLRESRGLTYVEPVEGAFSYLLTAVPGAIPPGLACDRDRVVPGETVTVRDGERSYPLAIPAEARPGERIWKTFGGKWIDFTVVPLCRIEASLGETVLRLRIAANVQEAMPATVTVRGTERQVSLAPDAPTLVELDLGVPPQEMAEDCEITVAAGALRHREIRTLTAEEGFRSFGELPREWRTGMCLRGEGERPIEDGFGAGVYVAERSCGGVSRSGLFMHPPYRKGEGYSFATFGPITVPDRPSALRALVGKGDGSFLGDGILFRVVVLSDGKENQVAEQTVRKHEWLPIEGDLTPWAGRSVRLKLVSDVGAGDDSSGDWAMWADMRLEGKEREILWRLHDGTGSHFAPPPMPLPGVTVALLRSARQAWLHYEGQGLSGTGAYGTYAVVNDVEIGSMAPANGNERENVWSETMAVPLTEEALHTLGIRNTFRIRNPSEDCFKVRNFWLEVELADGRHVSTQVSTDVYSQPGTWLYAEGVGVPQGRDVEVGLWFRP